MMNIKPKLISKLAFLLICATMVGNPMKALSIEPITGLSYIVTIMLLDLSSDENVEQSKKRLIEKIDEETAKRMELNLKKNKTNSTEANIKSIRTNRELMERTIADLRKTNAELRAQNKRLREILLELDYTSGQFTRVKDSL